MVLLRDRDDVTCVTEAKSAIEFGESTADRQRRGHTSNVPLGLRVLEARGSVDLELCDAGSRELSKLVPMNGTRVERAYGDGSRCRSGR